jgi:hypothetical protein
MLFYHSVFWFCTDGCKVTCLLLFANLFLYQFIPTVHGLFFLQCALIEDITRWIFYQRNTLTATVGIHKRQKTHIINVKGPFRAFSYINHFFITPTRWTLYLEHIYLPNLSYTFQCVTHHPRGQLHKLAQNCRLFTRLLHKMCYKVYNISII